MIIIYTRDSKSIPFYKNTIVLSEIDDFLINLYEFFEIEFIEFPIQINLDTYTLHAKNLIIKNIHFAINRNYIA